MDLVCTKAAKCQKVCCSTSWFTLCYSLDMWQTWPNAIKWGQAQRSFADVRHFGVPKLAQWQPSAFNLMGHQRHTFTSYYAVPVCVECRCWYTLQFSQEWTFRGPVFHQTRPSTRGVRGRSWHESFPEVHGFPFLGRQFVHVEFMWLFLKIKISF